MTIDYKLLGKRIKKARVLSKIKQEQIAEQLGVSVGYISQIERGVTKISLDTLAKYVEVICADMAAIINGVDMGSKIYLNDEIDSIITDLLPKERKMLLDFVELLINNR